MICLVYDPRDANALTQTSSDGSHTVQSPYLQCPILPSHSSFFPLLESNVIICTFVSISIPFNTLCKCVALQIRDKLRITTAFHPQFFTDAVNADVGIFVTNISRIEDDDKFSNP